MNFGSALRRRSRRPLRVVLPAVVVAAGLALTACGSGGKSSGGGNTLFVTSTAGIDTVPKADRRPVNDISGKTLDGKNLTVTSLKGKVVVLNVWGSWCPPCREEAPYFAKVAKDTRAKGVAFVGINTRDANKDLAIAFEKNYGIDYPSLYDPAGNVILDGFPKGSLNPQAIPSTIVLDRSGKIAARSLMAIDEAKLRKMITPLIAEK